MISARRRGLHACAAVLLALTVTTIGLVWGTRVAAGSDAYGYVSQVDLWLRGDLHIDQGFGARVPWPLARWTFLPLGYRPEPDGYRIVPQYPPGLPLLMAGATLVGGRCAMFWVVPICAGVLVIATYAIGRRLGSPGAALGAAWLIATSPTVLFMAIAPMSDVPAAAAWAVAIACVLGETRASVSAAAGGAAAATAILIRPNLCPLAAVLAAWLAWRHGVGTRRGGAPPIRGRGSRLRANGWATSDPALAFSAAAGVGVLAVAIIDARLYGSPFKTGYDLTDGFLLSYVPANLRNYSGWLASAEAPLALGGVACLFAPSRARALFLGVIATVWTIYLLYVPWDAWWYLRFLLATWPIMAIGAASLVGRVGRVGQAGRVGQVGQAGRIAAVALIVAFGVHGLWQAYRRETFSAARGEAKYVEVARAVESITDPDAVIISAQHSGSIRYYAGRLTLRWDAGDPAWLDRTVDWLAAHGHHPYFVLEPQEIAALRARDGPGNSAARLDWTPMVVFRRGAVTMYDAVRREKTGVPVEQEELRGLRDCPPQRPFPTMR